MKTEIRKQERDFKAKVELAERTPQEVLETMLSEYYEEGIKTFIATERKRNPELSDKEILIKMFKLHDKLKGTRNRK